MDTTNSRSLVGRIRALFNKIAKLPGRHAYLWDERISLAALVIFNLVAGLRALSLLQWIKLGYRVRYGSDRLFQKRTNFHALFTELYFVAVTVLLLVLRETAGLTRPVEMVSLYFGLEAVLWSVYYLFFRHFIERSFTIYHHAEYFLAFPLALVAQVLGIGNYLHQRDALGLVSTIFNLNYASPAPGIGAFWSAALPLLGVAYVVILLSNLRDAFPRTQIKPTMAVAIIGAGEVVRERLLPALVNPLPKIDADAKKGHAPIEVVEINPKNVAIFDLRSPHTRVGGIAIKSRRPNGSEYTRTFPIKLEDAPHDIIKEIVANQTPTIIATPPDSHFPYLAMLHFKGIRFAVEKPISVFGPEIRQILGPTGDAIFSDGFAMGYYTLEKALPLTYLYQLNPVHAGYLDIAVRRRSGASSRTVPWNEVMGQDNFPRRITVLLLEGVGRSPSANEEERLWTEDPYLGGLFYETVIHPLSMVQRVLGDLECFTEAAISSGVYAGATNTRSCSFTHIAGQARMLGRTDGVEVDIYVGKYMPERLCKRGVMIDYPTHSVVCDFDSQHLVAEPVHGSRREQDFERLDISVKRSYAARRYAVLTSLIQTFFENGWRGLRFDDFEGQRHVMRWLVAHQPAIAESQTKMFRYDKEGAGLPAELAEVVAAYQARRP